MTHTSGIYQNGKVVLDQLVDWPDGSHVRVVCEKAEAAVPDRCVDGSVWEDSTEAMQEWLAWFDALQPVFAGRELESFEGGLRADRVKEKEMLSLWEAKLKSLSQ